MQKIGTTAKKYKNNEGLISTVATEVHLSDKARKPGMWMTLDGTLYSKCLSLDI